MNAVDIIPDPNRVEMVNGTLCMRCYNPVTRQSKWVPVDQVEGGGIEGEIVE
jgi:hypothetical protein